MSDQKLALVSVSDKSGLEPFVRGLTDLGFEILSTGGTARSLAAAGLPITKVSDYTGAPEVMDGRVKTLHPRVHGGILARPTPEHLSDLARIGGRPIDIVVVNLYPFEKTAADPGVPLADLIEQIDIGGPCLTRAAAKNFERVTVVCEPVDYGRVLDVLRTRGEVPPALRFELSRKAFAHTAAYDREITRVLAEYDFATGRRQVRS